MIRPWHLRNHVVEPRGEHPLVVGIVNATPDSFFEGSRHSTLETALGQGMKLWSEGADILDVGGESTRPGAAPVELAEEIRRTRPVVAALVAHGAVVSIDTRHPEVALAALEAGAHAINDVSGLQDPRMLELCQRFGAGACAMHMRGTPADMQTQPEYTDVVTEVGQFLQAASVRWQAAGLPSKALALDPGIGFGKQSAHNHALVAATAAFRLRFPDHPWYLGLSRKSWIARLPQARPDSDRLAGSLGGIIAAIAQGCDIVRVHDVAATREAWQAFHSLGGPCS